MKSFSFINKTKIVFGSGRFSETASIVKNYGNRCLLVTEDAGSVLKVLYQQVKTELKAVGLEVFHFDKVKSNPTTTIINNGIVYAKQNAIDVVLGIGGGSSMDTAKAISLGMNNEGDIWDYRVLEGKEPKKAGMPIVLVTTTSGTGAQVTQASVITNPEEKFKSAVCNPDFFPTIAVVDPKLMLTLPPVVTAFTGFDAFTHLFEAYISVNTNEFIEVLAIDGMKRIVSHLKTVMKDGSNLEAREQMAWADTLGGYCIVNCGVVLPHGIAMAISGECPNISHGQALAIVFPECIRYTSHSIEKKFAIMARMLNPKNESLSDKEAAEKSYDEVKTFLKDINLDIKLSDFNVTEGQLEKIADYTFKLPDYLSNPIVPVKTDIMNILKNCY